MRYRRLIIPNATYFFTVVTYKRRPLFDNPEAVDTLRQAFRYVMDRQPFKIDAIAILPDHLHCLWTLPQNDSKYSIRWMLLKSWFTRSIRANSEKSNTPQALWQNRYWEHLIRDEEDYERHIDYIHYNPVKHGYVQRAGEWKHSSFHRFVDKGVYSEDWGSVDFAFSDDIGNE